MHEQSLMADLMRKIDSVARDQGVDRIAGVKVRIGPLAHISEDHFREHFLQSSKGTLAESARLEVETFDDISHPQAQDIALVSVDIDPVGR